MTLARLATAQEMPEVFALRHQVFVLGQGVPADIERDDLDVLSDHVVALVNGLVVGTGRLLPNGTVGRLAVASDQRSKGIGAALLAVLESRAAERGLPAVELHAQLHAKPFYDKAGYEAYGEVYLEAGIQHQSMRKMLSAQG